MSIAILPPWPSLPYPLWITRSTHTNGRLLADHCKPASDRRTWLLLLCESGRLPLHVDGERLDLGPQQGMVRRFPDNRLHLLDEPGSWQALAFAYVGEDALSEDLASKLPRIQLPSDAWTIRQLSALTDGRGEHMSLDRGIRLIAGVLANIVKHNVQAEDASPQHDAVRRAVALLDEAAADDRGLAELIAELGVSRAHLFRLFREQLGISPGRYLQERRLRCACRLLREGRMDIAGIAQQLGYSSSAAFGAAFKNATGLSPSDYRNSRSVPLGED